MEVACVSVKTYSHLGSSVCLSLLDVEEDSNLRCLYQEWQIYKIEGP
jgi:hypothetical protein